MKTFNSRVIAGLTLSGVRMLDWIDNFKFQLDTQKKLESDLSGFYLKLNVRNFLYNLYFRLRYTNVGITLQKEIEKVLDSIRDF